MSNGVFTSDLPLTKDMCKKLVKASQNRLINVLGIHIDTLHAGVGFLESVDEKCLRIEWRNSPLMVESQKPIRVLYEDEIDEQKD